MANIKLTKKQKLYLFTQIISESDLAKIFDTTDIDYLVKQNITLKDNNGWYDLYWDKDLYTSLNPNINTEMYDFMFSDELDDYEYCWWCREWDEKSYMVKSGRNYLCKKCHDYLSYVEGK